VTDRDITILDPTLEHMAHEEAWRGIAWQYTDEIVDHDLDSELAQQRSERNRGDFLDALPTRYRAYTFESLRAHDGNNAAIDAAQGLAAGDNLYLWGAAGNGKTHLAVAVARSRAARERCAFWNTATLFSQLRRAAIGEADWPDLVRPDLLVIDDLGKVKATEFIFQELYRVLEERWSNERSSVFTANHRPTAAVKRLADDVESQGALLSRLGAGVVAEVRGSDERLGVAR